MSDTNMISEIRQLTGLSQEQLAGYADISRSLLAMAENNYRLLPTAALLRLSYLHRMVSALVLPAHDATELQAPSNWQYKMMEASLAAKRQQWRKLRAKLDLHQRQQEQDARLLLLGEKLEMEWEHRGENEADRLWLNACKATLRSRQSKTPAKYVAQIECKLALCSAEIAGLEALLGSMPAA